MVLTEASVSDVNTLKFLASPESTNIYKWTAWEAASNELLNVSIGKDKREKDAPQILRASAVVDASVDEVMSILLCETTERLNTCMRQLDQTFLGGEVLCTVYPTESPYSYPSLPLCTIKRTCHELDLGRSPRDFVFVECCKFAQDLATGEKIGVRTMKSIDLSEVPPNVRGSSCTRAEFLEGSGMIVRAADHPGASEITFILRVDAGSNSKIRRAAAFFGKSKPELVSRMLYVVEQIHIRVEEAVSACGSWSEYKNLGPIQIYETRTDAVLSLPGKLRKQTGTTTWVKAEKKLNGKSNEALSRSSSSTSELSRVEAKEGGLENREKIEKQMALDAEQGEESRGSIDESRREREEAPKDPVAEDQVRSESSVRSESPVEAYMPHVVELSIIQSLLFEMVTSISNNMGEGLQTEQDEELAEIERLRIKMLEDEKAQLIRELDQFKSIEAEKQKLQDELSKWKKKVEEYETNPEGDKSGSSTPADIEHAKAPASAEGESELLKKYQAVLAKYEAIKASIPGAEEIDCIDGTLEDAEAKLKEFAVRIQENPDDIEAENMIERIDQFIRNHPEYKMRKERERQSWEDANLEKNKAALEEMKAIMTEEVLRMNKDQLLAHFKEKPMLAKRVDQFRKTYKAYYTDSSVLAKLHVASIVQDYQAKKLDIVELRAFYSCLPKVFVADNGKKKAAWRESVAEKLINLTRKDEAGKLSAAEKRNPAYTKKKPLPKAGGAVGPRKFGQAQRRGGKLNPLAASLQAQLEGRIAKNGNPAGQDAARPPAGLMSAIEGRKDVGQSSKAPTSFLDELKGKTPARNGASSAPKPSFLEELKRKKSIPTAGASQKPSFLAEIEKATTREQKPKDTVAKPSFLDEIKKKQSLQAYSKVEKPSFLDEINKKRRSGESKPTDAKGLSSAKEEASKSVHHRKQQNAAASLVKLEKTKQTSENAGKADGKNEVANRVPLSGSQKHAVPRKSIRKETSEGGRQGYMVSSEPLSQGSSSVAHSRVESGKEKEHVGTSATDSGQVVVKGTSPPKKLVDGNKLQELNKKVELLKQRKREMKAAQAKAAQQSQSKAEILKSIQSKLKKIPSKRLSTSETGGQQGEDNVQSLASTTTEKKTSLKQYSSRSLIAQMLKEQKAEKT